MFPENLWQMLAQNQDEPGSFFRQLITLTVVHDFFLLKNLPCFCFQIAKPVFYNVPYDIKVNSRVSMDQNIS